MPIENINKEYIISIGKAKDNLWVLDDPYLSDY